MPRAGMTGLPMGEKLDPGLRTFLCPASAGVVSIGINATFGQSTENRVPDGLDAYEVISRYVIEVRVPQLTSPGSQVRNLHRLPARLRNRSAVDPVN